MKKLLLLSILLIVGCEKEEEFILGCTEEEEHIMGKMRIACNYVEGATPGSGQVDCIYEDDLGECCSFVEMDECGICNGGNITCTDCDGTPNGEVMFDLCETDDCACTCNGNLLDNHVNICNIESCSCYSIEETTTFDERNHQAWGPTSLLNIFQLVNLDTLEFMFVDFREQSLSGIENLTNLKYLHFEECEFDEFPVEIFALPNLTTISTDRTNFNESELPSEIGNLTTLTHLDFIDTYFTGEIPSEIGNLTNLTYLNLAICGFSGAIPSELGNLTNLTYLDLSSNDFTEIPSEIGNLTSLTTLRIGSPGEIPSEIENLTSLTTLDLEGAWTGSIPMAIWNLTNLIHLYISGGFGGSSLSGSIPPEIGNLTQLIELGLWGTGLTGPIPTEIGNLTQLTGLNLSRNLLIGEIPPEIGNLTQLTDLRFNMNAYGDTGLTGEIPSEIGNLTNLTHLDLSYNKLEGFIPESMCVFGDMPNYEFNQFCYFLSCPGFGNVCCDFTKQDCQDD